MHTNPTNQFLMKWVAITTLGWIGAQALGIFITRAAFPEAELAALPSSPLYFGVFGVLLGLSQWICIHDRIPNSNWWVFATGFGCFVAALLLKSLNRSETINSFLREVPLLAYLFGGAIIGFTQRMAMQKTVQKAKLWTIAVAISWGIAQVFITVDNIVVNLLGVLVFATITGVVFVWLMQNPFSEIQPA